MKKIEFYCPGAKFYENEFHKNCRDTFMSVSVSGNKCALNCPHCGGRMLENMVAAESPEKLSAVLRHCEEGKTKGVLISGGCDGSAAVDLLPFCEKIKEHSSTLNIAVHCGFATEKTLDELKLSGVKTVFFDVIGSRQTAKKILGLDAGADEYEKKLLYMKKIGLCAAPHIVVGMDFGKIIGEYDALSAIVRANAKKLVLVVLKPLSKTQMAHVLPPPIDEVLAFFERARHALPTAEISLGCARPAGKYSLTLEKKAVDLGFEKIAYPAPQTVEYAKNNGLELEFFDTCCAL